MYDLRLEAYGMSQPLLGVATALKCTNDHLALVSHRFDHACLAEVRCIVRDDRPRVLANLLAKNFQEINCFAKPLHRGVVRCAGLSIPKEIHSVVKFRISDGIPNHFTELRECWKLFPLERNEVALNVYAVHRIHNDPRSVYSGIWQDFRHISDR